MNVRGQMKILITKLQSSLFTRTKKRMASKKKESLHGMAVKVFLSMKWECSMRHKTRFVLLFGQQCQLFLKDHIVSLLNKTKAFCSTISTVCSNKTRENVPICPPLSPIWIFEFLELENQKVCKTILNRPNFLKKEFSSAKNEKLHLFQALENWVILIFGGFDPKKCEKSQKCPFL